MSLQLTSHFLIAMPGMADTNFSKTLTLICEHNEQGAMGFVINRPMDVPVTELFSQQQIVIDNDSVIASLLLYAGGPVETERGFILHSPEKSWSTTMQVSDQFSISASRDIVEDTASGEGPEKLLFLLGYAGWGPGQLESEITENAWLTTAADPNVVFDLPWESRWRAAASQLGIDLSLLNPDAGHA